MALAAAPIADPSPEPRARVGEIAVSHPGSLPQDAVAGSPDAIASVSDAMAPAALVRP
jgi:hypothetical protein